MELRRRNFFLAIFACLSLVPAGRVRADDATRDAKGIQGTWEVVKGVLDGKPAPDVLCKFLKFVFSREKVTLDGGGVVSTREYSYKLDPSQKPKALDATPLEGEGKGKPVSCIYDLKGDELKLCLPNQETQDRPTEFKSGEGSKVTVFVLKRAK